VFLSFAQLLLLLQPAATGSGGGANGGGAGGVPPDACMLNAGMMAAILLFTYFFMIRPEQKRRAEADALLKSLKKGMKVRTTGGILGEIVSLTEHEVVLAVADKVRINVLRSHITGPEPEKRDKDEKDKDDKGGKKPDEARG
jgi:preprotein translocase subunit YajC